MNELRWILIGFGIVLLAGIYLWGRRSVSPDAPVEPQLRARPEPKLQSRGDIDDVSREPDEVLSRTDEAPSRLERVGEPARGYEPQRMPARMPATLPDDSARRSRLELTFEDAAETEELPARPAAAPAPTLSSAGTPAPRRVERRKILSLRLSIAPQRVQGDRLLECLLAESLEHGKYDVFHRLHTDGAAVFSDRAPGRVERARRTAQRAGVDRPRHDRRARKFRGFPRP